MTVLFSGGGTLGHIYPALSLIKEYIRKYHNNRIIFICTPKDKDYMGKIKTDGVDYIYYINSKGICRNPFILLKRVILNIVAMFKIIKIIKQEDVKIVVGMGGYISTITLLAAKIKKIKTVIHEQNSIMGLGNKIIEKHVDKVLLTFDITKTKNTNKYIVGNPRYYDALYLDKNIYRSKYSILITSGTLGSKKINDIAVEFLNSEYSKKFTTTLVTGKRYYNEVINKLNPGSHYEVLGFSENMLDLINKSGIVISRSGSTSMHEILAMGCPAIYIPSPNVTKNHQYYNAISFTNKSLGLLLEEKELTLQSLTNKINELVNNYAEYVNNINIYKSTIEKYDVVDLINDMVIHNE